MKKEELWEYLKVHVFEVGFFILLAFMASFLVIFCCGIKFLALIANEWTVGVKSFLCVML